MVKISVVVPVFNGAGTIKNCLKSILDQSFSDIEVIVINDGSKDNTLTAISDIEDSRLCVITIPNGGQGFARNKGIDEARGEYLAFVDADDTIERNMLETMYAAAKREDADVVQCNLYDIYPNGEKRVQLKMPDETVAITDRGEYTDKYFTPCIHSYEVCNKLIKRSAIGDLRFKDTRKYFSEDLLFNLELIKSINKITFVNVPLYNYFQHDKSHMHKNAEVRLKGLCRLFHDYIENTDGEMKKAAAYTAAMILSYSAGECADSRAAKKMFASEEFNGYAKTALTRKCKLKHRVFLFSMYLAPLSVKVKLCKMYGGRWQ